ncbi:MAG: hypothetical protein JWN73_2928 [Betaproteobacteria bacterium]|nr:hypothetical protein [Betaproteobacteria bacterium]
MKHAECPTPDSHREHIVAGLRQGALVGVVMAALALPFTLYLSHSNSGARSDEVAASAAAAPAARLADFKGDAASAEVRHFADWVADSANAGDSGYVIIDKKNARAYAFDAQSRLQGASPVLLGLARGDDLPSLPGSTPLKQISAEERTTPAGRFVGQHGHDDKGDEVVWVDYASALAMHRVKPVNPGERRFERIDTPGAEDNRISYGCINVPAAFFDEYINPLFAQRHAVVYILPEVKATDQVFGSYDVAAHRAGTVRKSWQPASPD